MLHFPLLLQFEYDRRQSRDLRDVNIQLINSHEELVKKLTELGIDDNTETHDILVDLGMEVYINGAKYILGIVKLNEFQKLKLRESKLHIIVEEVDTHMHQHIYGFTPKNRMSMINFYSSYQECRNKFLEILSYYMIKSNNYNTPELRSKETSFRFQNYNGQFYLWMDKLSSNQSYS